MEFDGKITLKPFFTNSEWFYVYCEKTLVGAVIQVGNQWRAGAGNTAKTYDSVLLAAFADANLSDPTFWS